MSKRLHLLGTSGLALCTAACGFPRPPDIGPDGGSDSAVAPSIVASNSVTPGDLAAGIKPLVVPAGATYLIDTDQGAMYDAGNGNAPIRVAGPGVKEGVFYRTDDQNRAFFAVESLTVGDGAILRGIGAHALILVAKGPAEIHGILDVSAGHCSITTDGPGCAGPGGGAATVGCSPGKPGGMSTGATGGGGGGGFASPGGAGGAGGAFSVMGGAGGSAMGCLGPTLDPIHGGSGGGSGGARAGGGGGGAVQVTSYTSITLASPTVANTCGAWAGGAGGGGGAPGGSGPFGGGGGGAGGAILFEAPVVNIRMGAVLAANGGGGGAGAATVDGKPGQFGTAPASGGSSVAPGGAGAAGSASAIDGSPGMMTQQSSPAGGGGGGGLGRIRINAIMNNLSDQAVLSPAPSLSMLPAS
jgi:hypothetical protein